MPLIKGKSEKSFKQNVRTEMHAGKPQKQSLAIAYAMKRKANKDKMAMGGEAKPKVSAAKFFDTGMPHQHLDQGGQAQPPSQPPPGSFGDLLKKGFNGVKAHGGEVGCPACGYSEGGFIGSHQSPNKPEVDNEFDHESAEMAHGWVGHEGDVKRPNVMALSEDDKKLNQHGEHDHGPVPPMHKDEEDIVDKILRKKSPTFEGEARLSQGGRVANKTPAIAGSKVNDFDDLVLRDDLESDYGKDDDSGDQLGNAEQDHLREDIIEKILKSRRKKDRLPSPA